MKPFSKNLFSQTPVAFGWLPKETINLDISVCVCVFLCVCAWACLLCVAHKRVGEFLFLFFFCCFVLSVTHTSLCKSRSSRKGQICKKNSTIPHTVQTILPESLPLKHNTPLITYPSFPWHHSTPSPQLAPQMPPQNILLCQHLPTPPLHYVQI